MRCERKTGGRGPGRARISLRLDAKWGRLCAEIRTNDALNRAPGHREASQRRLHPCWQKKRGPAKRLDQRYARARHQQQNQQHPMRTQMPQIIQMIVALPKWVDHQKNRKHQQQTSNHALLPRELSRRCHRVGAPSLHRYGQPTRSNSPPANQPSRSQGQGSRSQGRQGRGRQDRGKSSAPPKPRTRKRVRKRLQWRRERDSNPRYPCG